MATGGGQPTQQQVTTTTSNLPEYARPYFERLMGQAQSELGRQYVPYEAPRITGYTPAQEQVQRNILGLTAPNQFATGSALAYQAGLGALNQSQYNPNQFYAQQVQGPQLQQYGMQAPQLFGVEQAGQYMSPYLRNVLDVQKREAVTDARKSQLAQDLGAARQGTYGGSRQLLAALERERQLGQQLGDIEARGMQAGYESAQQQFERDRAAQMGVGERNLQSLLQTQQLGAQTGLQALLANQQYNLEAQRLGEQSRQFGAQQGLAGLQAAGQMGQTLGNLGQYQQQANLQRLQAQGAAAAEQRSLQQQYLDQAYADFLRQRDFPLETLQQYSSLLRGVPIELSSTKTSYAPPPSMGSQVLQAGLGGLSLARMTGGI